MSAGAPKLKDLVEELHEVATKWRSLGIQLEVEQSTLSSIAYETRGDCSQALSDMLAGWMNQEEPSWERVVDALKTRSVGAVALARDIEHRRCPGHSDSGGDGARRLARYATLLFLQAFPSRGTYVSITQQCAPNYSSLGIFLLKDDFGTKVQEITMANHYQPEAIMTEIFRQWISSGDHSWRRLVECLRLCSLNSLAGTIEATLTDNNL